MALILNVCIGTLCCVTAAFHFYHGVAPLGVAYVAFGVGYFALSAL